jgi:hypothetical protein
LEIIMSSALNFLQISREGQENLSNLPGQVWWLKPVILATWEVEIGTFKANPGKKVLETPSQPVACHPKLCGEVQIEELWSRLAQA